MAHHIGTATTSADWSRHCNDLIHRVCTLYPSNFVGVNINSASVSLLKYVSGLNALTARRVYEHRVQQGPFTFNGQTSQFPHAVYTGK